MTIKTTHTGSLPRPKELADLMGAPGDDGRSRGSSERRALVSAALHEVVQRQLDAGLDAVSDGEQPRVGFSSHIVGRMRGFGGSFQRPMPADRDRFPDAFPQLPATRPGLPGVIAKVSYESDAEVRSECDMVTAALAQLGAEGVDKFMTAPSPGIVATTFGNSYYTSMEDLLFALADELRKEYSAIVEKGFLLQIDAPDIAMERGLYYRDVSLREFLAADELHIEAVNRAIVGLPRDRVRLHVCWGNFPSPHSDDVELKDLMPILRGAKVGQIGIPFGNHRHHHELERLADLGFPEDVILVAGVVDTTTNYLEHVELISQRLRAAVGAIGDPARVMASPDCGFGTGAALPLVATSVAWAKLKTMVEAAKLASRSL